MNNLKIAFPEKSEAERKQIARKFYKNFVDNFIEVIKLISISKEELQRRFTCNYQFINDLYNTGKNIQLTLGHFFNWEFANLCYSSRLVYPIVLVYMPIESKIFNRLFQKIRKRFGTNLVAATNFKNEFLPYSKGKHALVLVGDQSPGNPGGSYWVDFFGKKTPFLKGAERSARMNDDAIVLVNFNRTKRGYYHSDVVLLTTEPRKLPAGEITKQLVAFIENTVRKHPANYLWSHRRWKWEFDEKKYGNLVIT